MDWSQHFDCPRNYLTDYLSASSLKYRVVLDLFLQANNATHNWLASSSGWNFYQDSGWHMRLLTMSFLSKSKVSLMTPLI